MKCHFDAVNFNQNPKGQGMVCLLWAWTLIDDQPVTVELHPISCYIYLHRYPSVYHRVACLFLYHWNKTSHHVGYISCTLPNYFNIYFLYIYKEKVDRKVQFDNILSKLSAISKKMEYLDNRVKKTWWILFIMIIREDKPTVNLSLNVARWSQLQYFGLLYKC